MTARVIAILALILLAQAASAQTLTLPPPNFRQGMPADVTSWLDRQEQCTHWYGEDPSDPKREKEINAALGKLKCDALPDDEDKLRSHHHDNANILSRLDQVDDFYSATD